MTPPEVAQPTPVPWWLRGADHPYDRTPAGRPNARIRISTTEERDSKHPHWAKPRVPGRAVLRQQARRRGQFKPNRALRRYRLAPVSSVKPLAPSFEWIKAVAGRKGGDR